MAAPKNTPENFWRKVLIGNADECWPWLASRTPAGYGQVTWHRVVYRASYVAYALSIGNTPTRQNSSHRNTKATICVLHSCDNPPCCNPRHLRLGTSLENALDRVTRGRSARGIEIARYGSSNRASKLSEPDILVIRKRIANGEYQSDIAKTFGVSISTISCIKKGKAWGHVI